VRDGDPRNPRTALVAFVAVVVMLLGLASLLERVGSDDRHGHSFQERVGARPPGYPLAAAPNDNPAMRVQVGEIAALFRYPVKSMGGESLDAVEVGWHGLDGDRRLGVHRVGERGGFPWLTASKLPELVLFAPRRGSDGALPTHVRTPEGEDLELFGSELAAEIGRRHGAPVEMIHLNRGIFDEASVSLIASATVEEIGRMADRPADVRRFRPNVVLRATRAFGEDDWVGGTLTFGAGDDGAAVGVTTYDERCSMVGLDPDTAANDPAILKAIVRERKNLAGVYATVTRRGRIAVGQPIFFEPGWSGAAR
jgi:uncharacterized protein